MEADGEPILLRSHVHRGLPRSTQACPLNHTTGKPPLAPTTWPLLFLRAWRACLATLAALCSSLTAQAPGTARPQTAHGRWGSQRGRREAEEVDEEQREARRRAVLPGALASGERALTHGRTDVLTHRRADASRRSRSELQWSSQWPLPLCCGSPADNSKCASFVFL